MPLVHSLLIPYRPHPPNDLFATPHADHSDPTWGRDP